MISVIVPAFNESEALPEVVEGLLGLDAEIVLVDDGSTDSTPELLPVFEKQGVKCLRLEKNVGKTEAFAKGIEVSGGDKIVLFESDGQYEPDDVRLIANKLESFDIANGVRVNRSDTTFRKLMSGVYGFLQRAIFGLKSGDANSGIKGFRREVAEKLFSESMLSALNGHRSYHRIVLSVAQKMGYRVGNVEVKHYPRKGGKSYISPLRSTYRTLATFIKLALWKKP